jgi:hypothetical protein
VSRIHLAALTAPLASALDKDAHGKNPVKRYAIRAPYFASYKEAVGYIAKAHPELKERGRLMDEEKAPGVPGVLLDEGVGGMAEKMRIDWKTIEEVFGVKEESCTTWKETVVDTVESLLELEKAWEEKGTA